MPRWWTRWLGTARDDAALEDAQRALRAAEAAERRAAFLADAGTVLGATLDLDAVLQQMTEIAVPRMGDWCAIFIRGQHESVRCVAFVHREQAKTALGRAYILARPISIDAPFGVGKVIRTGVSELTGEISEEQLRAVARDDEGVRVRRELGHGSVLIVPLRVGAAVIGAVSMGRAEANAYDPTDRVAAEDLGGRLALAIQNAELYRDAQEARARAERANWQSAFLAEASRLLASSVDYDATLDGLIRLSVPTIADWAVVHLVRRDGVRRIGPAYADPALAPLAETVRRVAPRIPTGLATGTATAVLGGRSLLVSDVTREWIDASIDDPEYRDVVLRLGPRSVIMVPLVARGRTVGSLTFVSLKAERRYGQADLEFAEEIGRRAGLAIDNARLYRQAEQARADAEGANRAKDEFLAVLSHELRTPLNAIGGWLHILSEGTVQGAQADRAIATVRRNVLMLRRLIEDLLDVSAIIAGKLTLEPGPCELSAIVEQGVESAAAGANTKGVHLKTDLEPGVIVEADALRVRQVVGNLLSNAIKFTPEGGDVTVTLHRADGHARIVVTDTGPGIPQDVLPHVFDRFRQGDSSSTRHHGGLGLGLAIVKHIVERHDGTVTAENVGPRGGARFTIALPVVTEI
jgi:signal transduction histidine kinase